MTAGHVLAAHIILGVGGAFMLILALVMWWKAMRR